MNKPQVQMSNNDWTERVSQLLHIRVKFSNYFQNIDFSAIAAAAAAAATTATILNALSG